jgi:hypothetical protein
VKESTELFVKVGFNRNPKKVFDEVESLTASMNRDGWRLKESILEAGLEKIHLFFEREITTISHQPWREDATRNSEVFGLDMGERISR